MRLPSGFATPASSGGVISRIAVALSSVRNATSSGCETYWRRTLTLTATRRQSADGSETHRGITASGTHAIAATHAALAVDLRKQSAVKLSAGQSKQEIVDFMVARYGDFVLYRPPLNARTLLLWVGPFVLLVVAGGILAINIRRRRSATTTEWTADNAQRARALLNEGDESL